GQPRREDGIAFGYPADGRDQVVTGDGLGDVAASTRSDGADDVLGGVGDRQREEAHVRQLRVDLADDLAAAPTGKVYVEQDHLGCGGEHHLHRLGGVGGFTDDGDGVRRLGQFGAHAGAEHRVVVDEDDRDRARPSGPGLFCSGLAHELLLDDSLISVPSPGAERIDASPPRRAIRSMIERRAPFLSSGTASGSNPAPRSRTNSWLPSSPASTKTSMVSPPECLAALTAASRAAFKMARATSSI